MGVSPTPVLYLHTTSEVGGSDVSLVRLIEGLDRSRYGAIVVLPSDGPLVGRLREAGASVVVMPSLWKLTSRRGWGYLLGYVFNFPRAIFQLRALIKRQRVGMMHTNTIHNLYGGPTAVLTRTPHVWHVREIVWQKGWLRRLELWMTRRMASRIVVTSEAIASMYGPPDSRPESLITVPNGIEIDRFHPGDEPDIRRSLGVERDEPLVGIVCRLDVWKGVDVFLEAAAAVAATRPAARFAIVGGPIVGLEDYARRLRQKATALHLDDRLVWTDWQYGPAAMPGVHRALDVMVLASTEPEPFGLAVIEAMASGRPVVATAHGGPAEIVSDGETGVLVPPKDAAALAKAITRLIDDPALRRAMGTAGRRRAEAHYSRDAYIAGVHRVYDDVLGAGAAN